SGLHRAPLGSRAPRARLGRPAERGRGRPAGARARARGGGRRGRAAPVDRAPAARGRRAARAAGGARGHRAVPGRGAATRRAAGAPARTSSRRRAARAGRSEPRRGPRALVSPGRPRGDRPAGRALRGGDRAAVSLADHPRAAHALGIVLVDRCAELQLAPAARARGRPRLRRLARGLPPRGAGPFGALLGARRAPPARLPRAARVAAAARADARAVKAGVVGHVEWVDFAVVDRVPVQGAIVHAREHFADAGGGGAVAAVQMRRLVGAATFVTAVGDDRVGADARERLREHGVEVHAAVRERAQRRCFTYLDADHERTITVLGARLVPHGEDPLPWGIVGELDAVYVTGGDAAAIRAARAARVVV